VSGTFIGGMTRMQLALLGAGLLAALGVGVGATVAPGLAIAGCGALLVIALAAVRPAWAACLLIGVTPLIAGIDRGNGLPLLRPYEALALLVGVGLGIRLLVAGREGDIHFGRLDVAILLMAAASSIYPMFMMKLRNRNIEQDDVLYALQLWKYYGVFLIMRLSIRTPRQVRAALLTAVVTATIVGMIAVLQSLHFGAVESFVAQYFPPNAANQDSAANGRGTATIGNAIAAGDVTTFAFAIAAAWVLTMRQRPRFMTLFAFGLVLGTLGSGQFSGFIGIAVAAVALGIVTGRLGRFALGFAPAALLGIALLKPVIDQRLQPLEQGVLPQSWQVRLDNLGRFFWPKLGEDYNWLTGVRPNARVLAPPGWPSGQYVYIESGQTWLLWSGGVLFLIAFYAFLWVGMRAMWDIAQRHADEAAVAARAGFTALVVIGVLMFTDPHLTIRASADLSFSLLGIAAGGAAWSARSARGSP
jgi:hypothetical protein